MDSRNRVSQSGCPENRLYKSGRGSSAFCYIPFLSAGPVEDELPTNRGHLRKEPQRGMITAAQPKVSQSLL